MQTNFPIELLYQYFVRGKVYLPDEMKLERKSKRGPLAQGLLSYKCKIDGSELALKCKILGAAGT